MYLVRIGDRHYIKRTSAFGHFHGSVVLTDDVHEALRFTRKTDAKRRAHCLEWRIERYEEDAEKLRRRGLENAEIVVVDAMP